MTGTVIQRACSLLLCLALSSWAVADNVIVIVRHGEKPAPGLGQLSCRGLNRAIALASVILSKYGRPTALYAPNPAIKKQDRGMAFYYIRPLATIEPLAIQSALPVTLDWGMTSIDPLADALLRPKSGVQIVAWEHHWAESLARLLLQKTGGNPQLVPAWNDLDFDSMYVIDVSTDPQGKATSTLNLETEGLNGLSDQCPRYSSTFGGIPRKASDPPAVEFNEPISK